MPCAFPQAYAEALLVIPKVLAQNSGHDPQESIVKLQVCVLQPWPSVRPFIGMFVPKYQLVCDDTRRRCHLIFSHPGKQEEFTAAKMPVGLDLSSGEALSPADEGIWDNYCVKKQLLDSW